MPPRLSAPPSLARILTNDAYERLLHTYGKSYPETVRAYARDFRNAPDLVAFPRDEGDVAAVLDLAGGANVAVIPFGCGSSVVGGVEPDVGGSYAGSISLDLRGLTASRDRCDKPCRPDRGGHLGPALEAQLKPHDLSIRHFPQSFEFQR